MGPGPRGVTTPQELPPPPQTSYLPKLPSPLGPTTPQSSLLSLISAFSPGGAVLRLVGGAGSCSGRLEVFHQGRWGTVCDDIWDLQDAGVVCRQLGCGTALSAPGGARFGRGSDHIWLDDVNCAGTEVALSDCRARPWGESNCTHGQDAGVVCSGNLHLSGPCVCLSPAPTAGFALPDVRLIGGPHRCAGRVEVRLDGRWGTVCDDGWDLSDVAVVCRQLGCGTAMEALSGKVFGPGNESDPVLMMDVQCQGTEAALGSCPYTDPEDLCQHDEDAGARCQGEPAWGALVLREGWEDVWGPRVGCSVLTERPCWVSTAQSAQGLRLVNSRSRCAGRVEVLHNQQWGTVCDDNWDLQDAGVVCRQLGCGTALSAPGGARFGRGSDRIWLDNVNCTGTEVALSDCRARPWGVNNCTHGEDAGVVCSGNFCLLRCLQAGGGWKCPAPRQRAPIGLVGGPHRCAGRVEVRLDGRWGTVCDDGWGLNDVAVVCRQLDCGTAMEALSGKVFGPGNESDPVLMMDVQCQGTEAALGSCPYTDPGDICQHDEDAGAHLQSPLPVSVLHLYSTPSFLLVSGA
uniref:SRCR domain-containing protein n=1 Tax=Chrysemys picta bellii TaxID=8478 RepID=A0A8C3FFE0_CHRPI